MCWQVETGLWNHLHLIRSLLTLLFRGFLHGLLFAEHLLAYPKYDSQQLFSSVTSKIYHTIIETFLYFTLCKALFH